MADPRHGRVALEGLRVEGNDGRGAGARDEARAEAAQRKGSAARGSGGGAPAGRVLALSSMAPHASPLPGPGRWRAGLTARRAEVRMRTGPRGGRAMDYRPADDRYEPPPTAAAAAAACRLPADLAGPLAQLRRRRRVRDRPRDRAPRLRPGRHALRPREQLRPAARLRRGDVGPILDLDLRPYRDELVISTKAGYHMWPGPYGEWGSRKYLLSSLDQSLKRMGLDYVDIFYSHRPDPETPLEETMAALDHAVRQGKALYAGISNYPPEQTAEAAAILRRLGTPCLIHQPRYSHVRPLDRGRADRRARATRASAASPSRRSPRACSPTATSPASRRTRARRRPTASCGPSTSRRRRSSRRAS